MSVQCSSDADLQAHAEKMNEKWQPIIEEALDKSPATDQPDCDKTKTSKVVDPVQLKPNQTVSETALLRNVELTIVLAAKPITENLMGALRPNGTLTKIPGTAESVSKFSEDYLNVPFTGLQESVLMDLSPATFLSETEGAVRNGLQNWLAFGR